MINHTNLIPRLLFLFLLSQMGFALQAQSSAHSNDLAEEIRSLTDSAWTLYSLNLDMYEVLLQADSLATYSGIASKQAQVNQYWAIHYQAEGNYDTAIRYQLMAVRYFESLPDKKISLSNAYYNLADNYLILGHTDKALTYARKSRAIVNKEGEKTDVLYSNAQFGKIYSAKAEQEKDPAKKEDYYKKSIEWFRRSLSSPGANFSELSFAAISQVAEGYLSLYDLSESRNKEFLDSASLYNQRLVAITPDSLPFFKAQSVLQKAFVLQSYGKTDSALYLMNKVQGVLAETGSLQHLSDVYQAKVSLFEQTDKVDSAFHYFKLKEAVEDSLRGIEVAKYTSKLETLFETEKKEKHIAELKHENKLATLKNQMYILISLLILIILVIVSYFFYLNRRKSHQLSTQNKIIRESHLQIENLIRESHHRIKNNLQIVSSLLRLHSKTVKTPEAREALTEAFSRVKTIAVLHQKLQGSQTFETVEIQDFIMQLIEIIKAGAIAPEGDISIHTSCEKENLPTDIAISIGLIINELITNSLKYAFTGNQGNIEIKLAKKESILELYIGDDGRGFDDDIKLEETSSLGFKIIKSLVAKHKGALRLNSDNGAHVYITLSL